MNYQSGNRYQNDNSNKRKQMEDEMNRFENEISNSSTNFQQNVRPNLPAMFIPHQLQRQHNRTNLPPGVHIQQQSIHQLVPRPMMPTNLQPFINNPLIRPPIPPIIPNHSPIINQQTSNRFKPLIQPPHNFLQQPTISTIPNQTVNKPTSSYTVTPMGLPANIHNVSNPTQPSSTSSTNKKQKSTTDSSKNSGSKKQKKIVRTAGGTSWEDSTLLEWDNDDFRIFCGDLGNDVNEDILTRAFNKYPSFLKCKVVRDKRTNKSKGYGFISFKEPSDFIKAMREMDGKYVGSRPIKLRRSNWKDRNIEVVKKKIKEKQKLGLI